MHQFRWWYAAESRGGEEGYEEAVQYQGLRESLISIAETESDQGLDAISQLVRIQIIC